MFGGGAKYKIPRVKSETHEKTDSYSERMRTCTVYPASSPMYGALRAMYGLMYCMLHSVVVLFGFCKILDIIKFHIVKTTITI